MKRSSNSPFIAAVILVVCFIFSEADAKTYYVNIASGNDRNNGLTRTSAFKTITKAVSQIEAGDTCLVLPGNYNERIQISQSGKAGTPIVLKAEGSVIMSGFSIEADYIHIIGFEISNSIQDLKNGTGIFIEGQSCLVENNAIHDVPRIGIYINAENPDSPSIGNCVIRGNSIKRAATAGIFVAGRNNLIEENDISRTIQYPPGWTNPPGLPDADGIRFFGSGHLIRRNFIHDILLTDPENVDPHIDCFQTWGPAHDIIFEQNFCENPNDGMQGFMISAQDGAVKNLTVRNNIIIAFRLFNVHDCESLTILHNSFKSELTFTGESAYGIELHNSMNARIENNLFYNVGRHSYSYLWKDNASERGLQVGYNCIFMSDGRPPNGNPYPNDLWQVDPKILNIEQNNFRLKSNSPLIDAGKNAGVFNDYEGNPRPQGRSFDIGAFEYDRINPPQNVRVRRP